MNSRKDPLQERFPRLRAVVNMWESQAAVIPKRVLELFDEEDLDGIDQLMENRRVLLARIQELKSFIEKWEIPGGDLMEVSRVDDDQTGTFL